MPTIQIAAIIAVTVLVTATVTWFLSSHERTRRHLGAMPIVKVRDVRPGQTVRVTGKLVLGESTLEAPFSHRVCAHYDAILEERFVVDWRETWHTVAHETGSRAFFLEDETGRIEIDPTRFDGIIVRDHHKSMGEVDRDKARDFLARQGRTTEIPGERALRYREGVLEAGEIVTALGKARSEDGVDGAKHLVLGEGDGPVRASDDPELVK